MEEQKERVEDVYSSEKSTHSEHSAQKEHSHHEKNEDHMRTEHHKEKDHEKKQEHPKQVQPIPLAKIETKTIEVPKENDDTDLIDFSGITKKATTFFSDMKAKLKNKKKGEPTQSHAAREDSESKDTSSFDITTVISFSKKHAKILIPIALILIAILVSTHFRMMSSDLPITDQWAQNTIDTNLQNQLQNQIAQQYPHLPQANREALVRQELDTLYTDNADQIASQKMQLSSQFKDAFKDENGDTYLLAIDPYLWYSEARNVVNHGHLGDTIIDGESYFSLRDGRLDKKASVQLHPYIGAYLFKFLNFFNSNISLMRAMFLLPAIIIALSLIPCFLIARKIAGNIGGFFAALFLAINGPLLSRTPAGFADTDPYNVFFPLLILWLFIEAYTSTKTRQQVMYTTLGGFGVGLYSATWPGWSFAFLLPLGVLIAAIGVKAVLQFVKQKKVGDVTRLQHYKKEVLLFITLIVTSGLFVSIFQNFNVWWSSFTRPIRFITLKSVGVKSIWPNVLTTVAEFNTTSFGNIIGQMGGNLLFALAIIGVILSFVVKAKNGKREYVYAILLLAWLASTAYAFTKGLRFAILIAPPFALSVGVGIGLIYNKASKWLTDAIKLPDIAGKIVVVLLFGLLLIQPLAAAQNIAINEVPSMNDQWYNTLTKIKNDAPDSVTTSWWDFGHWFVAISERRVTFDGGDQGERIHWVGRTLQTDSEEEAIGILRMLNCVQETAPHTLDEFTGDGLRSVKMLYDVFPLNREEARTKYIENGLSAEQAAVMIETTHCTNLLPNYYITSQDMIGKAGVWGHFGSWDFERATMFQNVNGVPRQQGVTYLQNTFGMSEADANAQYTEIQTANADRWIAPWPGYLGGQRSCQRLSETEHRCIGNVNNQQLSMIVDTELLDIRIEGNDNVKPNSLVYPTATDVLEKKLDGETVGFSLALIPNGANFDFIIADPLQVASTFTKLYFYNGHGMKCFEAFDDVRQVSGGRILTWKVDYQCMQSGSVLLERAN